MAEEYPRAKALVGSAVLRGHVQAGHLVVDDIEDAGTSYRKLTGAAPELTPIPVAEIEERGGKLLMAWDYEE